MAQKMNMQDFQWGICGMGRVDAQALIDFKKSTNLYPPDFRQSGVPVMLLPKKVMFSSKVGRTVYDVTAHFDTEGSRSVLRQFEKLILADDSQN